MNKKQFKQTIDTGLSFLEYENSMEQRLVSDLKGEKIVKKKISMGLVLALVLMLVTVAFAVASYLNQRITTYDAYSGEIVGTIDVANISTDTLIQLLSDRNITMALPTILPDDFHEAKEPTSIDISRDVSAEETILINTDDTAPIEEFADTKRKVRDIPTAAQDALLKGFTDAILTYTADNGNSFIVAIQVQESKLARLILESDGFASFTKATDGSYVDISEYDFTTQNDTTNHSILVCLYTPKDAAYALSGIDDESYIIRYELSSTDYDLEQLQEIAQSIILQSKTIN